MKTIKKVVRQRVPKNLTMKIETWEKAAAMAKGDDMAVSRFISRLIEEESERRGLFNDQTQEQKLAEAKRVAKLKVPRVSCLDSGESKTGRMDAQLSVDTWVGGVVKRVRKG